MTGGILSPSRSGKRGGCNPPAPEFGGAATLPLRKLADCITWGFRPNRLRHNGLRGILACPGCTKNDSVKSHYRGGPLPDGTARPYPQRNVPPQRHLGKMRQQVSHITAMLETRRQLLRNYDEHL